MAKQTAGAVKETRPEDSTVAWFVVLEDARRRRDHERAEQARRNLQRLGVDVHYAGQSAADPLCGA